MRDISRLGVKLLLITLAAGLLLGLTNMVTKEPIENQAVIESELARKEVLPDADGLREVKLNDIKALPGYDEEKFAGLLEVYTAEKDGKTVGATVKLITKGFGGDVQLTVGITEDGKVMGVKVGSHNETPGLGAKATEPDFQNQFAGKDAASGIKTVKYGAHGNDINAITGATITSAAVADGVNTAYEVLRLIQEGGTQ